MSSTAHPAELHHLLAAVDPASRDEAWAAFVRAHSRILFHTAKSSANGYDDTMERYTFVLDRLRSEDFRRLRKYASDGRTMFSTWLVVVARRLCVDYHRSRYGRHRPSGDGYGDDVIERKDLVDLVGARMDVALIEDRSTPNPEATVEAGEVRHVLHAAIGELPPAERMLLRLRFEDGASVREIVRVMGFPSQFHVYRRLKSVLAKLRDALERRGISESGS